MNKEIIQSYLTINFQKTCQNDQQQKQLNNQNQWNAYFLLVISNKE